MRYGTTPQSMILSLVALALVLPWAYGEDRAGAAHSAQADQNTQPLSTQPGEPMPDAQSEGDQPAHETAPPPQPQAPRLRFVMDFDHGIQNELGGYYNKFERSPSQASTFLDSSVYRGNGGRSLRVTADRQDEGFCGVWMHFFDFKAPQRQYFDASPYEYLSFWIRGEKGDEQLTVKLADRDWIELEDSLPVGPAREFMPGQISTQWRQVLVPLKRFTRLDLHSFGGLTLEFTESGKQTVYIDDVSFKSDRQIPTPQTVERNAPKEDKPVYPKAMWVWSTDQFLGDEEARRKLFEFCIQEEIDQLWLQLLYRFDPSVNLDTVAMATSPPEVKCTIQREPEFRELLRHAHQHRLTVHVLDGYPEFAQKPYHAMPLSIVDAVIDFNKRSKPDERFDGIHFDNEPYLISGWRDETRKMAIIQDFLELNAECQRRVSEHSTMQFGVDIPFWWDAIPVEFNGQTKPLSHHCIDLLDNVGIMNYRDTADGADGMIAHGQDWVRYADQVKARCKIYMGIETFTYQPTPVWFALGLPREDFAKATQGKAKDLGYLSRINGYRTQVFDDGLNIHVGIELPTDPTDEQEAHAKQTVIQIAKKLGVSSDPNLKGRLEEIRGRAWDRLQYDVEWQNPQDADIVDPENGDWYAGIIATSIMLPKITFAQEPYEQIQAQTQAAEDFFRQYNSYAGVAIHYYQTFKEKVDEYRKTFPSAD